MPAPHAASFPGPAALGRGVVVSAGAATPTGFERAPRYVLDEAALAAPAALAQALHHHWARREPVVLEHAVDNDLLRERETTTAAPWELGPTFGFERERLAHRVWANSYDLRTGEPVWWRGELAARRLGLDRGALAGAGDVLVDGRPVWVDGGPRGPVPGLDAPVLHRESFELLPARDPWLDGDGPLDDDLAADQHTAAVHRHGPARVLAPAGAGKTRTLTARFRHLLGPRRLQPDLLLAVAYNRRAADELAGRVGDPRARVRTIHSLAYAICRDAGVTQVLDERAVRGMLDQLVRFPKIQNNDPAQVWLDALADVRIGLRPPAEVAATNGDLEDLPRVVEEYRAMLADRNALDFDEQVCRAIELLCADVTLRDAWRARCTHLLVDEFQDLTPAYVLLLRLLAWPDLQVFGVGDDDQVIYGHAGADPRFLLEYDVLFPGAADHRLVTNHRCPTDVVTAASRLLTHNQRRVDKTILAAPTATPAGLDVVAVPATAMATVVRDRVAALIAEGVAPRDIAVLSRVNAALLPTQVLLTLAGLPTSAPLGETTLKRTGTTAAFAYLRIACAPDDIHPADLHLTVKRPSRGLTGVLRDHVVGSQRWSLDELARVGDLVSDAQADRLASYVAALRGLARLRADGAGTAALLAHVRTEVGLGEAMDGLDSAGRLDGSSHADDLAALEQAAVHHTGDPATFQFWLRDALRTTGDGDGVHLSSIHKVKGEEWPHVFVVPATEGLLPHRLAEDTEEERRVMHVAVTRGSTSVTVVTSDTGRSPFVSELTRAAAVPGGDPHGRIDEIAAEPLPAAQPAVTEADGTVRPVVGARLTLPGGVEVVLDHVPPTATTLLCRVLTDGRPAAGRVPVHRPGGRAPATPVLHEGGWTTVSPPAPPRRTAATTATTATGGGTLFVAGLAEHADAALVTPLFEQMRGWRRERSTALGKPAYTLFDNKTLQAIAERQPRNERELLSVPGVGPAKLEQYGDEVLALVADARGGAG